MQQDATKQTKVGGQLSQLTIKRNKIYRASYLIVGVVAVLIYYGFPAPLKFSKDTTELIILCIAILWCFFLAYTSNRWRDSVVEDLTDLKNKRPGWYNFFRATDFNTWSAEKPFMPLTSTIFIVLGVSGIIWLVINLLLR